MGIGGGVGMGRSGSRSDVVVFTVVFGYLAAIVDFYDCVFTTNRNRGNRTWRAYCCRDAIASVWHHVAAL